MQTLTVGSCEAAMDTAAKRERSQVRFALIGGRVQQRSDAMYDMHVLSRKYRVDMQAAHVISLWHRSAGRSRRRTIQESIVSQTQ